MSLVKIQSIAGEDIFEFPTLDAALRSLYGVNPNGNRFEKCLLDTPSRRTFKEANAILGQNGYRIYSHKGEVAPPPKKEPLKAEIVSPVDPKPAGEAPYHPGPDDFIKPQLCPDNGFFKRLGGVHIEIPVPRGVPHIEIPIPRDFDEFKNMHPDQRRDLLNQQLSELLNQTLTKKLTAEQMQKIEKARVKLLEQIEQNMQKQPSVQQLENGDLEIDMGGEDLNPIKDQEMPKQEPKTKTEKDAAEESPEEVWKLIAKNTEKHMKPIIDRKAVEEIVDEKMEKSKAQSVKNIVVTQPSGQQVEVGGQHYQFEPLLKTIAARVNVLLVGPAGSGKTSAACAAAKALSLGFFSVSVGMQTTKTEFFGYMDATGKYVRTLFREAFEHGGVFLIDEMDAGNANVLTSINQALANEYCAFADKMVDKHPDFIIVASANTFGTGANREYVGRNQLDAATLDRFAVINWNYDEKLEDSLTSNKEWLGFVRKCRTNADKFKIRTVVSPRASIYGSKLLASGIKLKNVMDMLIYKGLNDTEKAKIAE